MRARSTILAAVATAGRLVGAAGALLILSGAAAAHAATTTTRFLSPGAYEFTVPPGVSRVTVVAVGARGGGCGVSSFGGMGAAVTATVPVRPGALIVGVAGPGDGCDLSGARDVPIRGGGGVGGGGWGGPSDVYSAGGGGASMVATSAWREVHPPGLLVVAGGGGGAASNRGADAGTGASSGSDGDGGAGTLGGGGRGGFGGFGGPGFGPTDRACNCPWDGQSGSLSQGGVGGSAAIYDCDSDGVGGGGGGGGYNGGGGGGACNHSNGGGGGGGSSFVSPTGITELGPTPTSIPPAVSLTYGAPRVEQDVRSLRLGADAAARTLTVSNDGSALLVVAGALLAGADPDDFLIENRCRRPVAPRSSCEVEVRLAPHERGARSARLTLLTNAVAAPEAVKLSGGLGEGGTAGGRDEPARSVLITCPVRVADEPLYRAGPPVCRGRRVSGEIELTDTRPAVLRRGGVTYASGARTTNADGSALLALVERRTLKRGTYTLVLEGRRERIVVRPNATRGAFPRLSGLVF
jgi:hypothetical protein